MIKVLADKYLFELKSMLPRGTELQQYDPAESLPEGPLDYDALLTRTVTPVNRETLDRFTNRLSFVGTGSSGTDHVDRKLLEKREIAFSHAAGCNALSVAEYVIATLLLWSEERQVELRELKVGVVGVGHVGRQVLRLLEPFPVDPVPFDPPRAERDASFRSAAADEVLACDILTFHVPLTRGGPHPTRHWLDQQILRDRRFRLIVNTARGGVIDEEALLDAHRAGRVDDFILDVWENEPRLRRESAEEAFAATPHIAGYSVQAKRRASRMISEALCGRFGLAAGPRVPEPPVTVELRPMFPAPPSTARLITALHPVRQYETRLMEIFSLPPDRQPAAFNRLRSTFPLRNEFGSMALSGEDALLREIPESFRNLFPPTG